MADTLYEVPTNGDDKQENLQESGRVVVSLSPPLKATVNVDDTFYALP